MNVFGSLVFAGVFIALWYGRGELSVFNSIHVSRDVWHHLIISVMICTVMFMAAANPDIGGGGWPYFALGFAANRAMIAALHYRARPVALSARVRTWPTGEAALSAACGCGVGVPACAPVTAGGWRRGG